MSIARRAVGVLAVLGVTSCALVETFPEIAKTDAAFIVDACGACTDASDEAPPVATGLVGYYRGSGKDLTGNGNDAFWQGTAALGPDRFSAPNAAASFDGSAANYLEVPTNALLPVGKSPRSVSAWFLTSHDYKSAAGGVWNWGRSEVTAQRFGLLIAQPGEAYFVGEGADVAGGPVLNDGRWHNVVVTFDGATVLLYVDLLFAATGAVALTTVGQTLEIGHSAFDHVTPEPFTGSIDEVRIYDHVLTTTERRELYFAGGWK